MSFISEVCVNDDEIDKLSNFYLQQYCVGIVKFLA